MQMKYEVLLNDYIMSCSILKEYERDLEKLPKGKIYTQKRNGKEYHYHRYTENGKQVNVYLNVENYSILKKNLELRTTVEKSIADAKTDVDKLKKAITILGGDIYDAMLRYDTNRLPDITK